MATRKPTQSKTARPSKAQKTKPGVTKGKQPTGRAGQPRASSSRGSSPAKNRQPARPTSTKPGRQAKPAANPGQARKPLLGGMSLDRKLDMAGIVMALVGVLTLLSLLSASQGSLTGGWVALIQSGFGWGTYIFPAGLVFLGLWLVLRNFERIPQVSIERVLGFILFYAGLLVGFHFLFLPQSREAALGLAAAGKGGGYVGAVLYELLRATLGIGGAVIALLAWLLIALALALDVSVLDLFAWVPRLVNRLQDTWDEFSARRAEAPEQTASFPAYAPAPRREAADLQPGSGSQEVEGQPRPPAVLPSQMGEQRAWVLPSIADILDPGSEVKIDDEYFRHQSRVIEETLASFGAPAKVVEVNRGPTITQFGVEPDFIEQRGGRMRVRVGKIASLADDLALALSARTIRIQAPVPGRGYVGIEVPNDEIARVALRDVIESEAFNRLKSPLRFALGQDVAGNAVAADLTGMPHLLIAGTTGSGKSVCVNSIISCLLLNNTPDTLRLIMVDPKRVELTGYNGIPHLLAPVVVEMERVVGALQWVTREMDQRYRKLAQAGARNINEFNTRAAASGEKRLPYLVVFIDELADLMMLAPDETERTLTRLAQLARATGIHLVIATQRPSVDVVTGLIKANFPARIAFAVASGTDSRVILDQPGAERLLGRGDMLFQAPDAPAPVRLQGTFVSDIEIQRLVQYWQGFSSAAETAPTAVGGVVDALPPSIPLKQIPLWEEMEQENTDPLLNESIDLARRQGRASISMLQRRLRIGYTRAARLIEIMEEKGIIGPPEPGTGTREVLDYGQAAPPVEEQRD